MPFTDEAGTSQPELHRWGTAAERIGRLLEEQSLALDSQLGALSSGLNSRAGATPPTNEWLGPMVDEAVRDRAALIKARLDDTADSLHGELQRSVRAQNATLEAVHKDFESLLTAFCDLERRVRTLEGAVTLLEGSKSYSVDDAVASAVGSSLADAQARFDMFDSIALRHREEVNTALVMLQQSCQECAQSISNVHARLECHVSEYKGDLDRLRAEMSGGGSVHQTEGPSELSEPARVGAPSGRIVQEVTGSTTWRHRLGVYDRRQAGLVQGRGKCDGTLGACVEECWPAEIPRAADVDGVRSTWGNCAGDIRRCNYSAPCYGPATHLAASCHGADMALNVGDEFHSAALVAGGGGSKRPDGDSGNHVGSFAAPVKALNGGDGLPPAHTAASGLEDPVASPMAKAAQRTPGCGISTPLGARGRRCGDIAATTL